MDVHPHHQIPLHPHLHHVPPHLAHVVIHCHHTPHTPPLPIYTLTHTSTLLPTDPNPLTLTFLPLQDNLPHARWTTPLAPSTALPRSCMHCGLRHSCPLCSHPMPASVCVGTPQLSHSVLRDGKMAHPQQVQPLLADHVPTLTCSGALCALEHASVIHLAPCSIHRAPPGRLCPRSHLTPHSIHRTPPGHLCPRLHLTPRSIHRTPLGHLCPRSHLTPHSIHRAPPGLGELEDDDLVMFIVEHLKDKKGPQKLVEGLEPVSFVN